MRVNAVVFAALAAGLVAGYAHPAMLQHQKRGSEVSSSWSITQSVPSSPAVDRVTTRAPQSFSTGVRSLEIIPTIPVPTPSPQSSNVHPDKESAQAEAENFSELSPLPTLTSPLGKRSGDDKPHLIVPPGATIYTIFPPTAMPKDKRNENGEYIVPLPTLTVPLPLEKRSGDDEPHLIIPPGATMYTSLPPIITQTCVTTYSILPTPLPEHKRSGNGEHILPLPTLTISQEERNDNDGPGPRCVLVLPTVALAEEKTKQDQAGISPTAPPCPNPWIPSCNATPPEGKKNNREGERELEKTVLSPGLTSLIPKDPLPRPTPRPSLGFGDPQKRSDQKRQPELPAKFLTLTVGIGGNVP
ncbi:hypothetical protein DTO280E4_78 [Paecilomyces variotii]|nr:hypothetical protein DTO280E4_78 [Paecilomyces variotii]